MPSLLGSAQDAKEDDALDMGEDTANLYALIPRHVSFVPYGKVSEGFLEEIVEDYVKLYKEKQREKSDGDTETAEYYDLPGTAYDILMATISIKSCESSKHIRSRLGFPDNARFLVRFHESYLELKAKYEQYFKLKSSYEMRAESRPLYRERFKLELSSKRLSKEDMELLFAFKVAYRICEPLMEHKLAYLEAEGDEFVRQKVRIADEFSKMRTKLTTGHGRKEPVRFDAIRKAFLGRELSTAELDELASFFAESSERDAEQARKYISSSISWFNKHAKDLKIEIQIEAEKITRYFIRLVA